MEYYLSRAHEIARISMGELESLQSSEKAKGRCLFAHEVQRLFNKPPLRQHFGIPDDDVSQNQQALRIRSELRHHGIAPIVDFFVADTSDIHKFDTLVFDLANRTVIDFQFQSSKPTRRSFKDMVMAGLIMLIGISR